MTERQPDIEIYLKRVEQEEIVKWLDACFRVQDQQTAGVCQKLRLADNSGTEMTCTVTPNIVKGGYTSICFEPNHTPWDTDEACALNAFEHFQSEVRCSIGGWQPGDADAGGWYRFTENGRSTVNWLA